MVHYNSDGNSGGHSAWHSVRLHHPLCVERSIRIKGAQGGDVTIVLMVEDDTVENHCRHSIDADFTVSVMVSLNNNSWAGLWAVVLAPRPVSTTEVIATGSDLFVVSIAAEVLQRS